MPRLPDFARGEWDLEAAESRFTRAPAVAIGMPEAEWREDAQAEAARDSIVGNLGEWILDEDPQLGRPEAIPGSYGRGAEGAAAIIEWLAIHAAGGVVSAATAMAFTRVAARAREILRRRDDAPQQLHVSRGGAAYLAIAEVLDRFDEEGPLEIEAVEEPSSVSGRAVSELSYVGVEPWIVLLRNRQARQRYIVVVASNGEILGAIATPMGVWEHIYLPDWPDSEWS